ncbi:hypothetical protein ACFQY5_14970 [Paeniroseomonas aquatica]
MRRRWGPVLMRDPFYNPNLELHDTADRLAETPRCEPPWLPYLQPARRRRQGRGR